MEVEFLISSYINYLIIFLGSFLAILGLYIDKNSAHFKWIAPLFIALVVLLGASQALDSVKSDGESTENKEQISRLLKLVDNSSISTLRTSAYLTDILLSQPKILRDFGLTEERAGKPLDQVSTHELVTGGIIDANKYRMQLISRRPPSERLATKIWYYNKEMDQPELTQALKEIGFTVENKIPKSNQANDLTNAVWYGPDTNLDDYKAVILSLIRAGIQIRRLGPACNNLELKKGIIEIGSSDDAQGHITGIQKPVISVEKIKSANQFEDINDFSLSNCNKT